MARHEPEPTVLQTRHEHVLTCASRAVRTLAITIFTFNITFGAAWSVLVLYARQRLGMGAVGFGLITTAMALGGLAGTAATAGSNGTYGWA